MGKPEYIKPGEILPQQNLLTADQPETALETQKPGRSDSAPPNSPTTSNSARGADAAGLRPVANGVVRPKGVG